ncbi:MAG TPA: insulinase family protein, partial [Flavobacteriaceae bacterium]|nr:insulinase family protein [Flavobacteriaceae bacterium]
MKSLTRIMNISCLAVLLMFISCKQDTDKTTDIAEEDYAWKTEESGGYEYKYVENDPSEARFYTLDNGLTVILSPSHKKPRIQTYFAVKAGGKTDPAEHTGLAHYLEHMLFKGTSNFGSLDWEKEKVLLDEIENLYEEYNSTTDEEERKAIYRKIDEVSGEAATYAIANEYDKMMSGMGAQGTNAFTSFEETVYTEDIPSNVVDKYLAVQAERFKEPVFRLFHTELEAVYEEKNRGLDSDGRKSFEEMFKQLFPTNNYGKQTVIGTIEHLKNPSLSEIRKYFNTYYVPNNMGIIMAGDFDPDEVIEKIDEAFSYMESKEIPEYTFAPEKEISQPIEAEVLGPEPENILLGYRFPGEASEDAQMLTLVGEILTNGSAGMIDLNLVKQQKLLAAYAYPFVLKDYSVLMLAGNPTEGQSLDEVRELLLGQIDKLKAGEFSDDLITSIINNEKKDVLSVNESYYRRASELMDNFTKDGDWLRKVEYVDWLGSITKEDIVEFANKYFNDNYVAVYKRQGEDKDVIKVEKPEITPVSVNREDQSDFLKKIAEMPEDKIDPVWMNFDKDIQRASTGDYEVLATKNEDNSLFEMNYYFETGSWSNKLLPIAVNYLDYLGTENKSAEEISQEFYKLASSVNGRVSSEETYISIDGLQENFEETVALVDEWLRESVADQKALESYIGRLKRSRANAKENKNRILSGLRSYALYGPENPFNNNLTDEELDNLKAEDLVDLLHEMANYKHKILYYGPKSAEEIADTMKKHHKAPKEFAAMPESVRFEQKVQEENKIYFADYDMVQAEVFWVRNNDKYDESKVPMISFFNEYYGGGMGSIVFQTIRESKALAYSTFAVYRNPSRQEDRTQFMAYVGAQSDKFGEAVDAMNELLTDLPKSSKSVDNAKESLRKKLATQRVTGQSVIFSYLDAQKMGRDFDIRKNVYNDVEGYDYEDLNKFFKEEIKGKPYAYAIVAKEGNLDQNKLNEIGEMETISLEDIF